MILTVVKKLISLQGLSYMLLRIWWTLVQKRLRTVGEFLPTPYNFTLGDTAILTAWTLYNRQQANFDTCYVVAWACSLQQQNAGHAYAGLCHASSYCYIVLFYNILYSHQILLIWWCAIIFCSTYYFLDVWCKQSRFQSSHTVYFSAKYRNFSCLCRICRIVTGTRNVVWCAAAVVSAASR